MSEKSEDSLKDFNGTGSRTKETVVNFLNRMIGKNDAGVKVVDRHFLVGAVQGHIYLKARLGYTNNAVYDQQLLDGILEARIAKDGERAKLLLKTAEHSFQDEIDREASPFKGSVRKP